jgi:DNA primase
MAGRIPQSFIDDVLDRADIVDIVGGRIDLRKSGKNHSACCPFHDEKTPSFTVSQDKQFFYCFGCGAGGNAIGFIIDFDRVSFPEAVETLAKHVGLEVPREASQDDGANQYRKTLYSITEKADHFYRSSLRNHPNAHEAVSYLKARTLNGETARTFGIGYAPPGWDNLLQSLGKTDQDIQHLKDAGLLIDREEEGKLYDRFRHRIMFPIRDVRGRTIGFGGRVLGDDKPKYLNSPETSLFHKGRELYGLYEANRQLRDIHNLLVVEGYMDVAALSQHGIHNAVATLGTAATSEHLDKLFRYTSEVVFCFDGDEAGRKAARRALETSLPVMLDGRSAKFLFLPDGEDPDSLVQDIGCDQFTQLIKTATPVSDYLFESLSQDLDTESLDGRARLSKLAAPLINRMPQGVCKTLMLKTLSQRTGLDTETLTSLIEPIEPPLASKQDQEPPQASDQGEYPEYYSDPNYSKNNSPTKGNQFHDESLPRQREAIGRPQKRMKMPPAQTLIALLANHPQLANLITDLDALKGLQTDEIEIEGLEILIPLVELIHKNPSYTLNHILGYWRGIHDIEQAEQLTEIAATDLLRPVADSNRDNEKELQDILNKLLRHSTANMSPLELFHHLAEKETIDDQDLKTLNHAWLGLPDNLRNEETKALFNQIVKKPRHH